MERQTSSLPAGCLPSSVPHPFPLFLRKGVGKHAPQHAKLLLEARQAPVHPPRDCFSPPRASNTLRMKCNAGVKANRSLGLASARYNGLTHNCPTDEDFSAGIAGAKARRIAVFLEIWSRWT